MNKYNPTIALQLIANWQFIALPPVYSVQTPGVTFK